MAGWFVAPDGRRWKVRRRWAPRLELETVWGRFHRRFRSTISRMTDGDISPGCLDIFGEGVVAALLLLVIALVLVLVVIPLLVAIVDLVIVLILAGASILARIGLRRPWTIEARAEDGTRQTWRVVGLRASGAKVAEISRLLQSGADPTDLP